MLSSCQNPSLGAKPQSAGRGRVSKTKRCLQDLKKNEKQAVLGLLWKISSQILKLFHSFQNIF